ncbi:MAG: YncE family protein [Acidobacteriota bacterium]|nr:YncE family protein [Acidobacteriota bacterium]
MLLLLACAGLACAQPLRLEKTIPLPGVQGRIDHMSIDVKNQRLFVAALGNNTLEVVDLKQGKRVHTIPGLHEPQGILYVPVSNRLYIANGKDGTVRIYDGSSYELLKTIEYGDDADNLRYDAAQARVYVGYGSGSLGAIDSDGNKVADIKLGSHPESFQLEKTGSRIFVNLPKSRKIAVVDRAGGSVTASWGTGGALSNYPMSLDEADHRLFVICRLPARLIVLDTNTGKIVAKLPAAGDCDDVFYDAGHKRIYASGGEGAITVFRQQDADRYTEIAKIATVKGARTSFFSGDLGRLFLAVRRQGSEEAAIRVYTVQE